MAIECKECKSKNLWFSVVNEINHIYHYCNLTPKKVKWVITEKHGLQIEEDSDHVHMPEDLTKLCPLTTSTRLAPIKRQITSD